MEDQEIIELFFLRSERAIAELTDKYGSVMRRVAFYVLRDEQDVEECVNDACLGVWNKIPPERPDPLMAYVCRITKNLALNRLRHKRAMKRDDSRECSLEALEELEGELPGGITVEERWSRQRLTEAIQSFLDGLDRKSRVMFVKRYWFGESLEDIARECGVRANTVAVRLRRIRAKLKRHLENEEVLP